MIRDVGRCRDGSSVSVSVSPAQSSPGVVHMGLSRTRGLTLNETIPKRRFRRFGLLVLLLEDGFASSSVSEEFMDHDGSMEAEREEDIFLGGGN